MIQNQHHRRKKESSKSSAKAEKKFREKIEEAKNFVFLKKPEIHAENTARRGFFIRARH
jgi:hypothetical protein